MPPPPPPTDSPKRSATAVFFAGFRAAWRSVLAYVVIGTYVGIGALTHDFGFGLGWAVASTALVWAGPAQVILVSALGAGAAPVETALAVGVSSARLLPMVISLLPLIRRPQTPYRALVLPAHFTVVTMWIEALRLLPQLPREARIPFANGVGFGFMTAAQAGTLIGYYLATSLPPLLTAGLLFLTPVSFLISTTRNCRLAGARVRARARAADGRLAGGTRSALERDRGRIARLRHPPPARGTQMSELHAYTLLVLVGFLPSEIWRMLGLVVARGVADESELFMWVRAVAIAVLAGVIAKIILFPPGTLAGVPLVIRLTAIICGFAAFVIVRRSVLAGVVAGEVVLMLGALAYGI